MEDNTTEVSPPAETAESPTPAVSSPKGKPSPGGDASLEVVLRRLDAVEGQLRSTQSDKDKGIARVAKTVDALAEQLNRYEELRAAGLDPARARREMAIDELLGQRTGTQQPTEVPAQPSHGSGGGQANEEIAIVLDALGLNAGDADVVEVLRNAPASRQAAALAQVALKRRVQPEPNPAAVLPTGGGEAAPELMAQYRKEVEQAMTVPERLNIRVKYRNLGLEI